jgi:hypothetical protein
MALVSSKNFVEVCHYYLSALMLVIDLSAKFSHVWEDTSVLPKYIYHMNAQNPAGESAFSCLSVAGFFAKAVCTKFESVFTFIKPLIDRVPNLDPELPVSFLYGSVSPVLQTLAHNSAAYLDGQKCWLQFEREAGKPSRLTFHALSLFGS